MSFRVSAVVSLSALLLHRKILALFRRSVHPFQVLRGFYRCLSLDFIAFSSTYEDRWKLVAC